MTGLGRLQHYSSGGLALLVHGLFFGALMFGVSWKNPPMLPVQADLWATLPEPPAPLPEPPRPEPLPPPPRPEPVPVAPPPPPVEAKPSQADIALEKAEKKKQEALRRQELKRQEEEKRLEAERKEAAKQAELQRQAQELRQEQERAEKEKRDLARRQMEEEMARQMREELDAESAQLRAFQERAKAGRQARLINDFKLRIQAKIQNYVHVPQKMAGNPEAVFQVKLLPNGEVLRVTLVRSSGQPIYDAEVERAILKASPLPLPSDKEAAGVFRDGLTLKFRPFENGSGGT